MSSEGKTEGGEVTLKTVVFMGSAKDVLPPWGGSKRLGDRVLTHVKSVLAARTEKCGPDTVKHEVTVFDPLEVSAGRRGADADRCRIASSSLRQQCQ